MLNPRENVNLVGHESAKASFLNAFQSDRFPHAWIVAGPFGIGKATFAFHMARFLLSGRMETLPNDPVHRRIVADSHGDVRVIGGDDAREIGVEVIRELNGFLSQTSAEGGFRIVIIDGADTLNRNAANALLKRLEEPPPQTIFFLTTSVPGRLLPTIHSRCQVLTLSPLSDAEVEQVLKFQGLTTPSDLVIEKGSPGRLIRVMEGEGAQIYEDLLKVLSGASSSAFINAYGSDEAAFALFDDLMRSFLHQQLLAKALLNRHCEEGRSPDEAIHGLPRRDDVTPRNDDDGVKLFKTISLDQTLQVCEKVETLLDECRYAQLDKKATLTCVFETLALRK